MSEIIEEYGGMLIALIGTLLVITVMQSMFIGEEGFFYHMFEMWGSGAIK